MLNLLKSFSYLYQEDFGADDQYISQLYEATACILCTFIVLYHAVYLSPYILHEVSIHEVVPRLLACVYIKAFLRGQERGTGMSLLSLLFYA